MRTRFAAGGLAIAATVLLAACGSTTKPLTHEEFVAQANHSCRSAELALDRQRKPKTLAQFDRSVNRSGFIVQRLYDDLAALTPPKSDAKAYEHFLKLLDRDIRAAHAVERAVLNQRYTRLAGLQNGRVPAAREEVRYARALGISPCAGVTILEVPSPPKPKRRPATATAPSGSQQAQPPGFQQGPLNGSARTDFVAGCSARVARSACTCLYDQLTNRYHIDTTDKLLRLAERTQQALITGNPNDLPPELKGATLACRPKFGLGA